jgi:hypothetical protein
MARRKPKAASSFVTATDPLTRLWVCCNHAVGPFHRSVSVNTSSAEYAAS